MLAVTDVMTTADYDGCFSKASSPRPSPPEEERESRPFNRSFSLSSSGGEGIRERRPFSLRRWMLLYFRCDRKPPSGLWLFREILFGVRWNKSVVLGFSNDLQTTGSALQGVPDLQQGSFAVSAPLMIP